MTKQRSGCTESKKTIEFTPLFLNVCQCVLVVLWHHDGFTGDVQLPGTFPTGVFFQSQSGPQEGTTLPLQAWFTAAVTCIFEYLTDHEECLIYVATISVLRLFYGL